MPSLEVNINEGGTGDFWIVDEKGKDFSVSSTVSKDTPANGKGRVFLRGGEPYTIAKNSQFAIYRITTTPTLRTSRDFAPKTSRKIRTANGIYWNANCATAISKFG